jgi:LmbE family N-acetylglucosaminyl deacetylase
MNLSGGFKPSRVLAVGSHSDDIEIGCGGSLLRLLALDPKLMLDWVVLSAEGVRRTEALASGQQFVDGRGSVHVDSFRERYFPHLRELKEFFDDLGRRHDPDVVFCPWIGDAHQDHRTTAELVYNTFRNALILQYEIPKADGDLGRPSVFMTLDAPTAERKVDLLVRGFPSQSHRHWFDSQVFLSLMRLRGVEARAESGYAEAFHVTRLQLL